MTKSTLFVVRHGEQEAGAAGLSARGRDQATLLGRRLADLRFDHIANLRFDGIHHSPLPRAAETAHRVADALAGVPVQVSELLTDRTPVPAPGEESEYAPRDLAWLADVPPAERDEGGVRITAALRHFAGLGGRHLLVTHAFVIGWFVRQALDAPSSRWIDLDVAHAGLTVIRPAPPEPMALIAFNDTGHLRVGDPRRV